jgi:hypothetical protein
MSRRLRYRIRWTGTLLSPRLLKACWLNQPGTNWSGPKRIRLQQSRLDMRRLMRSSQPRGWSARRNPVRALAVAANAHARVLIGQSNTMRKPSGRAWPIGNRCSLNLRSADLSLRP